MTSYKNKRQQCLKMEILTY